jgi:hypothetical protein
MWFLLNYECLYHGLLVYKAQRFSPTLTFRTPLTYMVFCYHLHQVIMFKTCIAFRVCLWNMWIKSKNIFKALVFF